MKIIFAVLNVKLMHYVKKESVQDTIQVNVLNVFKIISLIYNRAINVFHHLWIVQIIKSVNLNNKIIFI